jgi:hypothetical protein
VLVPHSWDTAIGLAADFALATGRPVPAGVSYFVFADNPYLREALGFTAESHFWTKADGRFRLVVLPGWGILACRAGSARYPSGVGADPIKGADPQGFFRTYPYHCHPVDFNALAEVNPGKDTVGRSAGRNEKVRTRPAARNCRPSVCLSVPGRTGPGG